MLAEIQGAEVIDRAVGIAAVSHFATGDKGQPRLDLPADGRLCDTGQQHQRAHGVNLPEPGHDTNPNSLRIKNTVVRSRTPPSLHNPDFAWVVDCSSDYQVSVTFTRSE
ncbi:hypothetical protein D9M71_777550 [compost metagenome]